MADGLEEGKVETLNRLKVLDGLLQGCVGRGLNSTQEGKEAVSYLITSVKEGGVGCVLDMGQVMMGGVRFYFGSTKGQ